MPKKDTRITNAWPIIKADHPFAPGHHVRGLFFSAFYDPLNVHFCFTVKISVQIKNVIMRDNKPEVLLLMFGSVDKERERFLSILPKHLLENMPAGKARWP